MGSIFEAMPGWLFPTGYAWLPFGIMVIGALYGFYLALEARTDEGRMRDSLIEVRGLLPSPPSPIDAASRESIRTHLAALAPTPVRDYFLWLLEASTLPSHLVQAADEHFKERVASRTARLRPLPNFFLLLGIIGTVVGLAHSVASLGPQVKTLAQAVGAMEVADQLGTTLGHMRNAFSCTFWGALLSLLFAMVVAWLDGRSAALVDDVTECAVSTFIPSFFARTTRAQIDQLRQVAVQILSLVEGVRDLTNEWRKDLQDWATALGRVTSDFERSLETARQQIIDASQSLESGIETLRDLSAGLRADLAAVSSSLQRAAEELSASSNRLRDYHSELRAVYADLKNDFSRLQDDLRQYAQEQAQQLGAAKEAFAEEGTRVIAQLQQLGDRLSEATRPLADIYGRFDTLTVHIGNVLEEKFAQLSTSFAEVLRRHETAEGVWEQQRARVAEKLDDLMSRLDPRLLPEDRWNNFIEMLEGIVQSMQTIAAQARVLPAAAGRQLTPSDYSPLVEATAELRTVVSQLHGVVADLPSRLASALQEPGDGNLLEEVRELRQALRQLSSPNGPSAAGRPRRRRWWDFLVGWRR
ncbi:MAG: MotA/TolQ/ExbB proton channel family protein [Armatimonadetes bacterium]|nr:MotA/TolQ/ExbB proton channel family protein [Armatimonadota bacterium]